VLLYAAFFAGGDAIYKSQQGQRPRSERAKEARIQRAMNAITTLIDPQTGNRKLLPEGGILSLDQEAFLLLEKYLEESPIPTALSAELEDLMIWVSAAEKKE
jgi:hypothetical protein